MISLYYNYLPNSHLGDFVLCLWYMNFGGQIQTIAGLALQLTLWTSSPVKHGPGLMKMHCNGNSVWSFYVCGYYCKYSWWVWSYMPWKYLKIFLPQNGHIDTFFFFSRIVNGIQMGLLTCEMSPSFLFSLPSSPFALPLHNICCFSYMLY